MECLRRLRNVTRQRDITCYGTMMGRFPRLTPVRLGHQVPDLTTVSGMVTEEEDWLRQARDSTRFTARALSQLDIAGESVSDMVVVERGVTVT